MVHQFGSTDDEDDEDTFVMEAVTQYRRSKNNKDEYLVKWQGYSDAEATWEPLENILEPGEEIRAQMAFLKDEALSQAARKRARTSVSSATPVSSIPSVPTKTPKSQSATASTKDKDKSSKTIIRDDIVEPPTPMTEDSEAPAKKRRKSNGDDDIQSVELTGGPLKQIQELQKNGLGVEARWKVAHVQKGKTGLVHAYLNSGDPDVPGKWVPLDSARQEFSSELLDYLIPRIKFRASMDKQVISQNGSDSLPPPHPLPNVPPKTSTPKSSKLDENKRDKI